MDIKIFDKYPKFTKLPPDFKLARVEETFKYYSKRGEVIEVKEGFVTDGASIPKFAWSIIGGPFGEYAYAAFVHDYAYCYQLFPRKRCDEIFEEAMGDLRVGWIKRKAMYFSVRWFGWIGWNMYKRKIRTNVL